MDPHSWCYDHPLIWGCNPTFDSEPDNVSATKAVNAQKMMPCAGGGNQWHLGLIEN